MTDAREHSFPEGTVSVKLHKRKRLTLVVGREELNAALVERIEVLEYENKMLRRKVTELTREYVDNSLGGEQ